MSRDLSLAPCGLVIERIDAEIDVPVIRARPMSTTADCPICGSPSATDQAKRVVRRDPALRAHVAEKPVPSLIPPPHPKAPLEHVCSELNLGVPARPNFWFKRLAGVEASGDGQAIL